jgi:hypothetical protein
MCSEFVYFASVKTDQRKNCLTIGMIFYNPLGRGCRCQLLKGFVFIRHAVRAKLWQLRSLVQVNSVLDLGKPQGQIVVFLGVFFFCLPFFKVLTRFLSLYFLLIL